MPRCRLTITSPLPSDWGRIPFSPVVDFGRLIAQAGAQGVLDPNSIVVVDLASGTPVAFARSEDLAYGDRGRIEWTIDEPDHIEYEIRFATADCRPALVPQSYVPLVGNGDLLRYNAPSPRPLVLSNSLHLIDLTGDGRADLAGCWNYYHRPGAPISGLVCCPRIGTAEDLLFGDMARLRYVEDGELKHFPGVYVRVAFADIDGDGRLELIGLEGGASSYPPPDQPCALCWRCLTSADPIQYGPPQALPDVPDAADCTQLAASQEPCPGLLLQCNTYQHLVFYELTGPGQLVRRGLLQAPSPPVAWSDQAWPCAADWDNDGVWDLVIGGGYGWPRLVHNRGDNQRPAFDEPQLILSTEGPIRVLRGDLLGGDHWHNMGYPYPVLVDWDGDGLLDLMLPNETNRIIWHRNIGTDKVPYFGPRQFIEVEGFADSPQTRAESGLLSADPNLPNHPYPTDPRSPFFWRTGAAFADWNGDGLMDFITHSYQRQATLFIQYMHSDGQPRVRTAGPVLLEDGRPIDDSIVGRQKHWTESFRACDWDGDGLIDLIYNLAGTGEIYLLHNVGSPQEPVFAAPRQFKCYGTPIACTIHGPNAWAGDLNGDGKPDLLACVEWSVYPFFAHAALEMDRHPQYRIELVASAGARCR